MNHIIEAIQAKLETLTGLGTIDIDWGQLDEMQDSYPVLFPCALIDVSNIDWEPTGTKAQPGDVLIKITTGIEIPEDSHSGSGTTALALARMAKAQEVHAAVNLLKGEGFSKLIRVNTNVRNMYGIKVYTVTYKSTVVEIED